MRLTHWPNSNSQTTHVLNTTTKIWRESNAIYIVTEKIHLSWSALGKRIVRLVPLFGKVMLNTIPPIRARVKNVSRGNEWPQGGVIHWAIAHSPITIWRCNTKEEMQKFMQFPDKSCRDSLANKFLWPLPFSKLMIRCRSYNLANWSPSTASLFSPISQSQSQSPLFYCTLVSLANLILFRHTPNNHPPSKRASNARHVASSIFPYIGVISRYWGS